MKRIYFLKFNNYCNRTIKRYETLEDYLAYATTDNLMRPSMPKVENNIASIGESQTYIDCNFEYRDGITTNVKFLNKELHNKIASQVDYALVCNVDKTTTPETVTLESRWFIIDNEVVRGGERKLTLRRDLVAENYNEVLDSVGFIERGYVSKTNPLLLNSEGQVFNQIKESETLLYDKTGCGWLVGYLPQNWPEQDETVTFTIYGENPNVNTDYTEETFEQLIDDHYFFVYKSNYLKFYKYRGPYIDGHYSQINARLSNNVYGISSSKIEQSVPGTYTYYNDTIINFDHLNATELTNLETDIKFRASQAEYITFEDDAGDIYDYDNDTIYHVGSHYYKLHVIKEPYEIEMDIRSNDPLYSKFKPYMNDIEDDSKYIMGVMVETERYRLQAELINDPTATYSMTIPANRPHTSNSPYDVLCIPYSSEFAFKKLGNSIYPSKEFSLACLIAIEKSLGSGVLFDTQILPYCPVNDYVEFNLETPYIDVSKYSDYSIEITGGSPATANGFIMISPNSKFTVNLPIEYDLDINEVDEVEYKIENETTNYRICSPNYASFFEMNICRNGGELKGWKASCHYKPYNPFILVKPEFKGLYNRDFNDQRGLICSGDFSIPNLNEAWRDYELQNKNYQLIFNRQQDNLEIHRKTSKALNYIGAGVGAITGGASGAIAGGLKGGVPGAIGGALTGGLLSLGGGIADAEISDYLSKEDMALRKDVFDMQLGNIQALPNTLTNVGCLVPNHKIVPFIEKYVSTDQESAALRTKLEYNAFSLGVYGRVGDYMRTGYFIKANIIRADSIHEDAKVLGELNKELNIGVYM